MVKASRRFPQRVWAVEGCNGIGRHLAHRLVYDGETVLDVPAKLSAQVRVFATGNGRKTDPVDAHSVAIAALHAAQLNRVEVGADLAILGMLADRRDELAPRPHADDQPATPPAVGAFPWRSKEIPLVRHEVAYGE